MKSRLTVDDRKIYELKVTRDWLRPWWWQYELIAYAKTKRLLRDKKTQIAKEKQGGFGSENEAWQYGNTRLTNWMMYDV